MTAKQPIFKRIILTFKRITFTPVRIAILCAIVLVAAFLCWLLAGGNAASQITVEAGAQTVDANAYIRIGLNSDAFFATDLSAMDLCQPGDYPVQVTHLGRTYDRVLKIRDTVSPAAVLTDITTVSVFMPEAEDFVLEIQDATPVTVAYAAQPDLTREGTQTVELLLTDTSGNTSTCQASLTVIFDGQAPVIEGINDIRLYLNQEPDYLKGVTVTDDLDEAPSLIIDDSYADLSQAGTYPVVYVATDASGNTALAPIILTVIEDHIAPSIFGVHDISLYVGSTVSYRSGIKITDDTDANPKLQIDSSQVDLSQPGNYEVTYIATDGAGNENRITASVTVAQQSSSYVSEDVIYAAADEILAQIITEDMTNREKVEAIYTWVTTRCYYSDYTDKTDWMQAAYRMMTRRTGNCFGFYAVSKLFFDRLGFPNMMAQRIPIYRPFNHYWNMVSIDGGETYFHYDATPRSPSMGRMCLRTDAELDRFDQYYITGYYTRDTSLYPATPEELPEE